eukprot:10566371-Alexandrium_andersonii.AAC.1
MPSRLPAWGEVFPGARSNKNQLPGQPSTGVFPTILAWVAEQLRVGLQSGGHRDAARPPGLPH